MKQKLSKRIFPILFAGAGIILTASSALAVNIPCQSVVNPLTQTLYTVSNDIDPPEVIAYQRSSASGWLPTQPATEISLTAGSKCYGLAISTDGKKLAVSESKANACKVKIYSLDAGGLPSGNPQSININDIYIRGITFANNNGRIYIVGAGKVHYIDYNSALNSWSYNSNFSPELAGLSNLQNVAVSDPTSAQAYKIFVSRRVTAGKIYIYNYSSGVITYKNEIAAEAPTCMKVIGSRLYVSMTGESTEDVRIYSIQDAAPYLSFIGSIRNPDGVSGTMGASFGWKGFDITPDGKTLYFTQAQDINETSTKIYKVSNVDAASGNSIPGIYLATVTNNNRSDGLVVSPDRRYITTTYSGSGLQYPVLSGLGYILPVITSINPTTAETNSQTTTVTIKGNYYLALTKPSLYVTVNQKSALSNIQAISPTELKADILKANIDTLLLYKKVNQEDLSKKLGLRVDNYIDAVSMSGSATLADCFTFTELPYAPNSPMSLSQFKVSGASTIALANGEHTNYSTVQFTFKMSDPNYCHAGAPMLLTPEVKTVRTVTTYFHGNPFTYTFEDIYTGEARSYDGIVSAEASITASNLGDGDYYWYARVRDQGGLASAWKAFQVGKTSNFVIDHVSPEVQATVPANGATIQETKPAIKITFKEAMDTTTLNNSTVTIAPAAAYSSSTYLKDGATVLVVTPEAAFNAGQVKVTMTKAIRDLAGNPLKGNQANGNYTFSFNVNPGGTALGTPEGLTAEKDGDNVKLTWQAPTVGEPNGGYRVLRGTEPNAINNVIIDNLPPGVHTATDTGAVLTQDSYFYTVKAFSAANESSPSNTAVVVKVAISHNDPVTGLGNKHIISIPYDSPYITVADIVEALNNIPDITQGVGAGTQPTKVELVARFNPENQSYENVIWTGAEWMADTADGSMPPVIKGEGYEISSLDNSLLVFFGAHDNNFAFNLAHNANGGNKHIISVPYNTTALNLGQITSNMNNIQDITGAGAATPPTQVELIARFNSANQMPENVIWTGVEWMADTMDGSMPPMVRGEGLEISTINNMNWKPAVVQ